MRAIGFQHAALAGAAGWLGRTNFTPEIQTVLTRVPGDLPGVEAATPDRRVANPARYHP